MLQLLRENGARHSKQWKDAKKEAGEAIKTDDNNDPGIEAPVIVEPTPAPIKSDDNDKKEVDETEIEAVKSNAKKAVSSRSVGKVDNLVNTSGSGEKRGIDSVDAGTTIEPSMKKRKKEKKENKVKMTCMDSDSEED